MADSTEPYLGIVRKTAHGFCIFYPDVPGHLCPGYSFENAVENAPEALKEFLAAQIGQAPADGPGLECPAGREVGRIWVRVGRPAAHADGRSRVLARLYRRLYRRFRR